MHVIVRRLVQLIVVLIVVTFFYVRQTLQTAEIT